MSIGDYWWMIFGSVVVGVLLVLVGWCLIADKHVVGYYLADEMGNWQIGVDVENGLDDYISINHLTPEEVGDLLDRLNNGLSNYKGGE